MASFKTAFCCAILLLIRTDLLAAHDDETHLSTRGKPLVKARKDASYKTLLSVDGGALRGVISAVFLVEVEQAIKRYLLSNPELLPPQLEISSVDDFDINLVDYFDCMTGVSAGSWATLFLASRGGQGAASAYLSTPEIVARYGQIEAGSAKGLIAFYTEFAHTIYPLRSLDPSAGILFDATNPSAPGVSKHLFALTGLETALETFLGNATLQDLDTTYITYAYDLSTVQTVFFVQNRFGETPMTSAAALPVRSQPRSSDEIRNGIQPDFAFDNGKDYYLSDIGAASGAVPMLKAAKEMGQVGSDAVEYLMIDGGMMFPNPATPALYFLARELHVDYVEDIAVLSVGTGKLEADFSFLAEAGTVEYCNTFRLIDIAAFDSQNAEATLLDYFFYGHPGAKPYQYLRVQYSARSETEEGAALQEGVTNADFIDDWVEIGKKMVEDYSLALNVFVRDYIFE